MQFLIFPSFRNDDSLVQLSEFLSVMPDNNWIWSILEYYGVGVAPNNLAMADFEEQARLSPKGFIMSWNELQQFAGNVVQTYDCLLVGAKALQDIAGDKSEKETFISCEVIIEAFDSTEWAVWARDAALMDKFKEIRAAFNL